MDIYFCSISRSARQGCPIAPRMYILQAEPLACAIRENDEIQGLKLPRNKSAKLNMFADDTQLFNKTETSILNTFKTLKSYEKASGSKINKNKTVVLYIGRWKNKNPEFNNISWTKGNVKTLGIHHGYEIDNDKIWRDIIQKLKNCLQVWKTRDLTFGGKVQIIKSFILSTIKLEVEIRGIPAKHVREINKYIWDFIWSGKSNQISRRVCCNTVNMGGMGMIDLETYIHYINIKTVYRIIHSRCWNNIARYWLQLWDRDYQIEYFICKCSNISGLHNFDRLPVFYQNILHSWIKLCAKLKPHNKIETLQQIIFGNNTFLLKKNHYS